MNSFPLADMTTEQFIERCRSLSKEGQMALYWERAFHQLASLATWSQRPDNRKAEQA